MSVAQVRREVVGEVQEVWDVVTDWTRHGDHVWLTDVTVQGAAGVGQQFLAVTALGPIRLRDLMEVTQWEPPVSGAGRVRLEKRGSALTGWAEITVKAIAPGRSEVVWREEIVSPVARVPGLGRIEGAASRAMTHAMIARLATGLTRDAEGETS
ncbi:SRPBCC family protein [Demetria terragena]|uniref:SRPBCC family protein n=1 Tax=Demetria terragena TaxID=63959 RepID=UPI00035FE57D|nr:SRPBCC family protein [Demetria terragena]